MAPGDIIMIVEVDVKKREITGNKPDFWDIYVIKTLRSGSDEIINIELIIVGNDEVNWDYYFKKL